MNALPCSTHSSMRTALLVGLPLLAALGCGVPDAVVWFPDSNRFLYADQEGSRLVEYDVTKGESRVVLTNAETNTPWPGLSADGKLIAIGKSLTTYQEGSSDTTVETQVLIYDLNGELQQTSSLHTSHGEMMEPSFESKTEITSVALNWSGPPEKILLHNAIWDRTTDQWLPLEVMPMPFENVMVSPDKRGFVALADSDESEGLCFVDWQGRVKLFVEPEDSLLNDEAGELLASAWQGDKYCLYLTGGVVEYDTKTMQVAVRRESLPHLPAAGNLTCICKFADGRSQLCLFEVKDPNDPQAPPVDWSLQWQAPDKNQRKVLLTAGELAYPGGLASFFPSPDRTKVAVDTMSDAGDERRILVYDAAGEKVADVAIEVAPVPTEW